MSKKAKIIEGTKALNNATRDKKRILGDALATLGGVSSALVPNYAERNSVPSASLPVLEKAFVDTYEKKDVNPISRMSPILNTATALTGNVGFKLAADMGSDNSYQNSRQKTRDLYNSIKNTKTEKALENADVPEINTMPTIMGMSNGAYGLNNAGVSREDAQRYYDKKNREKNEKRLTDLANAHPVLSSLGAVVSNPIESAEGNITNGLNYLLSKPLEESYTPSNTIRQTVSDKIDSKAGKFAYNVGNSMADMALAALLGKYLGNTGAAAGTMGLEKANQVMNDAIERGLNPDQIVKEGASSGLSTALTEMLPFDMLKKGGNVLGAMAAEGGQEVAEDILDSVFDELITRSGNNKDKAALRQQYNAYKDAGYSDAEALDAVSLDYLKQLGLDFAAGAISGGALQGGSNFLQGRNVITGKLPTLETQTEENITAPKVDVSPNENDTVNEWDRQAQERRNEDFAKLNELLKQQTEKQTEKPIEELQKPVEEAREEKPIEKPVDLNEVKAIAEETENAIPEVQPNPAEIIAQQREVRDLTNLASQYENKLNAFASESDAETKKIAKGLIKDLNNAVKSGDVQAIRDSIANIDSTMQGAQVGYDARKFNKEAYQQMQEATDGYKIKIKPSELNNLNLGVKNVSEMDAKYGQTGSRNRLRFVAPTNENGFYIDEVYDEIRDKSANALPDGNNMNSTEKLQALMKYISDPKSDRGDLLNVQSWEDVGTYDSRPEPVIEAEKLSDKFVDDIIAAGDNDTTDIWYDFQQGISQLVNEYPNQANELMDMYFKARDVVNNAQYSDDVKNIKTEADAQKAISNAIDDFDNAMSMDINFYGNETQNIPTLNEDRADNHTGKLKESKYSSNSAERSGIYTEEELQNRIPEEAKMYDTITHDGTYKAATENLKRNGSVNELNRLLNEDNFDAVDVNEAYILATQEAANARAKIARGETPDVAWKKSVDIFKKLREQATKGGQLIDAYKVFTSSTPEGKLAKAIAFAEEAQKDSNKDNWLKELKDAGKADGVVFSDEFINDFLQKAHQYDDQDVSFAKKGRLDIELAHMVNQQIPKSLKGRFTSLFMDNLLASARTLISRNLGGNLGKFLAEQTITKWISGGIDSAVSNLTGERTTTGLNKESALSAIRGLGKGAFNTYRDFFMPDADVDKGLLELAKDFSKLSAKEKVKAIGKGFTADANVSNRPGSEGNFKETLGNNRSSFNSKPLKVYDKLIKFGLAIGDNPFYQSIYDQTITEMDILWKQGKLPTVDKNGKKITQEKFDTWKKAYATAKGLEAVYQDNTKLSEGAMKIKNGLADMSEGYLGFDILSNPSMPFVRTPMNVIKTNLEYSPLGVVKNTVSTVKEISNNLKNNRKAFDTTSFNQSRFVAETSRNIVGILLFAAGMGLKDIGLITGGYSENKKEKQAQKEAGEQEFAFANPLTGTQSSMDWIPVVGSSLIMGASFKDAFDKSDKGLLESITKGAKEGSKSLFEQAALQGLQRLTGSQNYNSDDGIVDNAAKAIGSTMSSAVVPSFVRQIAAANDPYKRNTYSKNDKESILNNAINGIPFLRQQLLEPRIDSQGNPMEQNAGRNTAQKWYDNLLNPALTTVPGANEDPVRDEARRLLHETGNYIAFQPQLQMSDITTDDFTPTAEDYRKYAENANGSMNSIAANFIDSDYYQSLNSGEQEAILSEIYSAVKTVEKDKITGKDADNYNGTEKAYYEGGEEGLINYLTSRNALKQMDLTNDEKARDALIDIYNKEGAEGLNNTVESYVDDYESATKQINNYINSNSYIPKTERGDFTEGCLSAIKTAEKYKALGYDLEKLEGPEKAYITGGIEGLYDYKVAKYYLDSMGLTNNEKNRNIVLDKLNEGGVNAVKEMAQNTQQMQSLGFDTNMTFKYEHAQKAIPTLSPTQFAETWNAIDQQKEGESGYGSIKIDEVIDYLNKTPDKYNDKTALQLWNAYYSGDSAKIPVLDPKTGLWKAK